MCHGLWLSLPSSTVAQVQTRSATDRISWAREVQARHPLTKGLLTIGRSSFRADEKREEHLYQSAQPGETAKERSL